MSNVRICCIIDDDPIFIYGTKRIMKEVNFSDTILEYNNGQEALEELSQRSQAKELMPEVIFLDLNMPIMNGWEFLEEFEKLPIQNEKRIIIYIVSSSVDPRDLECVKDFKQVDKYILKPITPNDLEAVLGATKSQNN